LGVVAERGDVGRFVVLVRKADTEVRTNFERSRLMSERTRLVVGVLGAAIVMSVAVGSASATRLAFSNRGIRAVWTAFELTDTGISTVRCPVTIEGTFHSNTITKISAALIGYITRAIVRESSCVGGSARALPESLPWHIQYTGFAGALPEIEQVQTVMLNVSFLTFVTVLGSMVSCLFRTTAAEPVRAIFRRAVGTRTLTDMFFVGAIRSGPGGLCPRISFGGVSSSLTVLGETAAITVTLVA
jgi:hypothetical protein